MKNFLQLAAFLLMLTGNLYAQPFSFEKLYSHNIMSFNGVARMLHSNNSLEVIIVGNAEIGSVGDGESVIIKADSNGTMLNTLIIGKPMFHDVCIQAMEQGSDYYFAGYTRSTDTSASPLFTSFLIKTDANLNVIWQRNYIFPGNDFIFKTTNVTASGDFLFSGSNYEFSSGNWYSFVMKTNANGNVELCKMSNAFLSFDPGFITELSNHDILLTGSVTLGFEIVNPTAVRFDSLGNMIWAKVFDYDLISPQHSKFLFARELTSGNILLSGHCDYYSTANIGLMDFQVFKIDSAGTVLWMKTYGGGLTDWLYGADFNPSDNKLMMTGTSQSYVSNSLFYGYVVSVDTSGIVTNAIVQGDTSSSHEIFLYNTSMLGSGNFIFSGSDMTGIAGFYVSKYNPGATGQSSCHTFDVTANSLSAFYPEFIYSVTPFPLDINIQINAIPFDYYTGINDSLLCYNDVTSSGQIEKTNLEVFPNPASGSINLVISETDLPGIKNQNDLKEVINIYNSIGIKQNYKLSSGKIEGERTHLILNISQLSNGIYFLEIGEKKIRFEVIN